MPKRKSSIGQNSFSYKLTDPSYRSFWKNKLYETPKGTFLTEIDKEFAYETYLDCPFRKTRILTTKLRTSDHNLAIEKGRHSRPVVPRENRLCEFCHLNSIETELHFLSDCPAYITTLE